MHVLTHIDVYDSFDEISACVAYEIDGQRIDHFPSSVARLNKAKPVLQTFPGWNTELKDITSYKDLPKSTKDYLSFIEDFTGTPINIISVGYDRSQTIIKKNPWTKS